MAGFLGTSLVCMIPLVLSQNEGKDSPPTPPVVASGGIVAVVGDQVITQAELDRELAHRRTELLKLYSPAVIDRQWQQLMRRELNSMINDKLVLQLVKKEEKKRGGPYIAESQVDNQIKKRVEDMRSRGLRLTSPDELYGFYLENYGMRREQVRTHLKDQMAIGSYFWQEVFRGISNFVSPKEAWYYYQDHKDDFSTPIKVSFRWIVISRSRSDFSLAVENVEKGVAARVDFLNLARQWADAAVLEGDLERAVRLHRKTFKEIQDWSSTIRNTLATMKKGEVSPRLDTPTSVHFFKMEEVVSGKPKSFKDAQAEIKKRILMSRRERARREFMDVLRKKTRIEVLLPAQPSDASTQEKPKAEKATDAKPE